MVLFLLGSSITRYNNLLTLSLEVLPRCKFVLSTEFAKSSTISKIHVESTKWMLIVAKIRRNNYNSSVSSTMTSSGSQESHYQWRTCGWLKVLYSRNKVTQHELATQICKWFFSKSSHLAWRKYVSQIRSEKEVWCCFCSPATNQGQVETWISWMQGDACGRSSSNEQLKFLSLCKKKLTSESNFHCVKICFWCERFHWLIHVLK